MSVPLTARQLEVLQCMANGMDSRQTGRALDLAPSTVRTHQRFIYAALGVSSGLAAVAVAVRDELVEVPR